MDAHSTVSGVVNIGPLLGVVDTPTVDLALSGSGTAAAPFRLSANLSGVDLRGGAAGNVLTRGIDGVWRAGPATQAPPGAMTIGAGLRGDGSGGDPIRLDYLATYADLEANHI